MENKFSYDPMYIRHYEEEYNIDKMRFLIENPDKTETDFVESKIENLIQQELEHDRKCKLSDDEVREEVKKTEQVARYIRKGIDETQQEDFDIYFESQVVAFRKKYIFKEKKEDSLRLKFYKTKLANLPNSDFVNEEAESKEKTPFKIALLKKLGFFELPDVKKLSKESQYLLVQKITDGTRRTIKGNILVLNPESNEDRMKYTANNHLESAKNYLDKLS